MFHAIINYITQNPFEILGTIFSSLYVFFAIKEKPSAWIFGGIGALFFIFVFFQHKIYAVMSLQFYYVTISIYGYWNWKWGKKNAKTIKISSLSFKQWIWVIFGIVLCFSIYVYILIHFTDSSVIAVSIADSFSAAAQIVATYLAAKKIVENWLVFIVADATAIGLYLYNGMYPSTILFTIYVVMAVVGYLQWKKEMKMDKF